MAGLRSGGVDARARATGPKPADRHCGALSAPSLRTTSARRRQAEHNGPVDGPVAMRLAYTFVHVSVALLAPIRTARPLAGERAVRIAGHHQDGGPTLEQAGHHQRVPDHLGDANLLAVVPVELERAGGCQGDVHDASAGVRFAVRIRAAHDIRSDEAMF